MGRFHATKSKVAGDQRQPDDRLPAHRHLLDRRRRELAAPQGRLQQGVAYGGLAYAGTAQAVGRPARRRSRRPRSPPSSAQLGAAGAGRSRARASSPATRTPGAGTRARSSSSATQAHVGVSYRSKIKHDITGDVTFQGAPTFSLPGALAPIGDGTQRPVRERPGQDHDRAARHVLGRRRLGGREGRGPRRLDVHRLGARSSRSTSCARTTARSARVPLQFQNTWRAGLGVNYKLNDDVDAPPRHRVRQGAGAGRVPHAAPARQRPRVGGGRLRVDDLEPEGDASTSATRTSSSSDAPSNLPNQDTPTLDAGRRRSSARTTRRSTSSARRSASTSRSRRTASALATTARVPLASGARAVLLFARTLL